LELEKEKAEEARERVEKQQHNLMRLPDLEREVALLRDENRNLRFALCFFNVLCIINALFHNFISINFI
jgi:hypothetical protein